VSACGPLREALRVGTESLTRVLAAVLAANESGLKLFNRWDSADVEVKDISLTDYVQVRNAILLPHTAGRYAAKQFRKAQMPIVERLVNR
jgi:small subunit ribosomal protein S5e